MNNAGCVTHERNGMTFKIGYMGVDVKRQSICKGHSRIIEGLGNRRNSERINVHKILFDGGMCITSQMQIERRLREPGTLANVVPEACSSRTLMSASQQDQGKQRRSARTREPKRRKRMEKYLPLASGRRRIWKSIPHPIFPLRDYDAIRSQSNRTIIAVDITGGNHGDSNIISLNSQPLQKGRRPADATSRTRTDQNGPNRLDARVLRSPYHFNQSTKSLY
uniref:Uncharacterized protein n=1 Tax=Oryza brachyantha TaxID=4533 RepID=J3MWR2_ORYBR